jgi:hypothetical protein
LAAKGHTNVMGWSSSELDLRDSKLTMEAIKKEKPDVIIMVAPLLIDGTRRAFKTSDT